MEKHPQTGWFSSGSSLACSHVVWGAVVSPPTTVVITPKYKLDVRLINYKQA